MKKLNLLPILSIALILSLIMITYTACKKDTEITCNLSKTDNAPADMSVIFKAVNTGDGAISTLTYKVGSTTKTISNPTLPWSVTVDAFDGDAISITAEGTTSDGSLTVSYDGKGSGHEIEGSDNCSHSNN